ncbi:hypothetical protein QVD17_31934 [Tagetes erecta]|uniref:Uncharacterized protein n=1 Tax=Tagetes erecta TaxID=13708 RepID=A0AAD8NPP9_TARER|nr:hypothetical protein QVD17_31934 [Tagetes erecta]
MSEFSSSHHRVFGQVLTASNLRRGFYLLHFFFFYIYLQSHLHFTLFCSQTLQFLSTKNPQTRPGFMSATLLAVIRAPLKLCFSFSFTLFISSVFLCWCFQQGFILCFPTVSMRLRPKRTCSGVECFGGFHINRLFDLFLFFRGNLT